MARNKWVDEKRSENNNIKDRSNILIGDVIGELAFNKTFMEIKNELVINLKKLISTVGEGGSIKLRGVIEQVAQLEVSLDIYESWWIKYQGVDFDVHKDKNRLDILIKLKAELNHGIQS